MLRTVTQAFGCHGFSSQFLHWFLVGTVLLCSPRQTESSEFLPFLSRNERCRSNIGINNLAAKTAEVLVTLHGNDGLELAAKTFLIPPGGYQQINDVVAFLLGSAPSQGFDGYLSVESADQISAFASVIDSIANDPGFVQSVSEGWTHSWIPSTTSVHPYRSAVAILNLANEIADVELKLWSNASELLATLTRQIEPHGQIIFSDLHAELGVPPSFGPLELTCKKQTPIVATCRVSNVVTGTHGFLPASLPAKKSESFIPWLSQSEEDRTNVTLSNPNDQEAAAQLLLTDVSGSILETRSISIPPHGSNQARLREFASIGDRPFTGSLRIISQLSLIGFASIIDTQTGDPGFARLPSKGTGQQLVPAVTTLPPYTSSLVVSNQGDSPTSVVLQARTIGGASLGSPKVFTAPAKGQIILDDLSRELKLRNWFGPLQVDSMQSQPLTVLAQVKNNVSSSGALLEAIAAPAPVKKRLGETAVISWAYDPGAISRVNEFRVYQMDGQSLNYRLMKSVPRKQLELQFRCSKPGKFIFTVTAFDGANESLRSAEVTMEVSE
jgi:hypothetical protein